MGKLMAAQLVCGCVYVCARVPSSSRLTWPKVHIRRHNYNAKTRRMRYLAARSVLPALCAKQIETQTGAAQPGQLDVVLGIARQARKTQLKATANVNGNRASCG